MDEERLKLQFARIQLDKGIRDIFARQLQVAQEKIYSDTATQARERRTGRLRTGRSGALLAALQSPAFSVSESSSAVSAEVQLPLHSRFIDMKRHGGMQVYNKPLFGILYRDVLSVMKYEIRGWIAAQKAALQAALQSNGVQ